MEYNKNEWGKYTIYPEWRSGMKPLIVIVEDDRVISELVKFNLESEGYEVKAFESAEDMFNKVDTFDNLSLFVLDIMLSGIDGFEICKRIKENPSLESIPVIMLTARGSEKDKVRALDTGADDYITKPFGVREFLARANANIRRHLKSLDIPERGNEDFSGTTKTKTLECAGIRIDDGKHRVYKNGKEIDMTNREYELLKFMMNNKGIAYSREDLLTRVWGYDYAGETRTVDVHIRQLRRKLEDEDSDPHIIETVRGRGYRFTEK